PVATPFSTHLRLVSPRPGSPLAMPSTEFRLDEFDHVTFRTLNAAMGNPYQTPAEFKQSQEEAALATERVLKATKVEEAEADPVTGLPRAAATAGFIGSQSPGSHYAGDLFTEIQRYAA